jgi:large subunit ribosomal protein L10
VRREDKAKIIEQFKDRADRASICVVTDFKGMSVEEMTELRKKLRESGVDYQVIKNTLARIAVQENDHKPIGEHLKENNAVAFGYDDPVAAAKVLTEFAKGSKALKLKLASLEGSILDDEALKELSKLPGREELLAKMLGTMNAVPTNFVSLFANLMRGLMNALQAIEEQKQNA